MKDMSQFIKIIPDKREEPISAKEFWKTKFDEYPQTDADKLAVAMMTEYAGYKANQIDAVELDELWNEVMGIAVKANYYLTMNHTEDFRNEMDKLKSYQIFKNKP